ncbi:hypothetical protein VIGAN_10069600 [Vigna angularis var. angularis]|uniref:DNA-directed RNA polymerase n=1 Tax=Vigna angularis var. angularis TaxID=157739 RepID=A0A0S3T2I8_PHAAN|nr:hypothetical protein VIGAN_10069600 [Vigna angularis var. angularis]
MNADLNVKKTQCLQRCVYLAADGGRLCRPLVIVKKGKSKVKKHHIKELFVSLSYTFILETKVSCKKLNFIHFQDGELTFDAFLRDGLIEYLDADEQNDVMVRSTCSNYILFLLIYE